MADWYIWSAAAGANSGVDWANAFTSAASISAKAAGDNFWVAHDHAQSSASLLNIQSPGTEASPCRMYCVDRAGSVPPVVADLRTTATITTTGASNIVLLNTFAEVYGITFTAGSAANVAAMSVNNTAGRTGKYTNCNFRTATNQSGSRINIGATGATNTILENCTMQFGATTQRALASGRVWWRNTPSALTGGTYPATLFLASNNVELLCEGVDLANVTGTLVDNTGSPSTTSFTFKECKIAAGTIIINPSVGSGQQEVYIVRSDNTTDYYRNEKYNYQGVMTTDAVVYMTGGAVHDTTNVSWKIVTTPNSEFEYPFVCPPIFIWNETTGSAITVTLEGGIAAAATNVPNGDIWMDVEYPGTSGFTTGSVATSGKATTLHANSNYAAGAGTWNGGVVNSKFKMTATFTPQVKGLLTIYIKAGAVSGTWYVDPKPVIT